MQQPKGRPGDRKRAHASSGGWQGSEVRGGKMTSVTDVGFIFQFPAMKGTRAISRPREAVRAERGAAAAPARSGAARAGIAEGGTAKAAAEATPVAATRNRLRCMSLTRGFSSVGTSA